MSGTLATKRRIVGMLKGRNMNITEISEALKLSKATVSQHVRELEELRVVEPVDNPHFKRTKYYRYIGDGRAESPIGDIARRLGVAALIIIGILTLALVVIIGISSNAPSSPSNSTQMAACPLIRAYSSANPANLTEMRSIISGIAAGSPCEPYPTQHGIIAGRNYTSDNGTVQIAALNITYTLNSSQITRLESNVNSGDCWETKSLEFFGINYKMPAGVRCRADIYS